MNGGEPTDVPEPPFELVQLVGAALEGELSRGEAERLRQLLLESPEARRYYLGLAEVHALLAWEHAGTRLLAAPERVAPGFLGRRGVRTTVAALAGAAAVAAAVTFALKTPWLPQGEPAELAGRSAGRAETGAETVDLYGTPNHARLIDAEGAEWSGAGADVEVGRWLPDGRVRLRSGRLTISFDSGVVAVAEGPAALDIEGPNRSYLHFGKLLVQVPPQAAGFVLNTPTSSLLDLGTRFGTLVDRDGTTVVHVVEGAVEVTDTTGAAGGATRLVGQGEAVAVRAGDGSTIEQVPFRPDEFSAEIDKLASLPPPGPLGFVRWAFDEAEGRATRGVGSGGEEFVGILEGSPGDDGRWVEGVSGSALAFDGSAGWLSTDYPGVAGSRARTVAFWIRTPPQAPATEADVPGILTWGAFDRPGAKWEFVPNPYGHNGAVGALRLSCKEGFVVGTTDIQNGRWHHVAVVFGGGEDADIAGDIRFYVDGKLDRFSGFRRGVVDTGSGTNLTVGKYVDPTQPLEGLLRGAVDELIIFDGALTPQQVERLWRRPGDPPFP